MVSDMSEDLPEATKRAIEIRREIHKWPEIGNEEYRTSEKIAAELKALGIPFTRPLSTGVVGILEGNTKGPVIGLRADIDGIPVVENLRFPYSSERPGFMHACGHDVHTAILLGAATVLKKRINDLAGSVKFIFQPAEETMGGAERMIDAGCLENPAVDIIFGFHVKPEFEAGEIGLKKGKVHAFSDQFRIKVKGKAGHGAYPESGVDAIVATAQIICSLQTVVSRFISPLLPVAINVGSVQGGKGANIICDEVELDGTVRFLEYEQREQLKVRIKEIVEHTAKAMGGRADMEFTTGYDALINHQGPLEMVRKVGIEHLGKNKIIEMQNPSLGTEDFAFYLNHVPGAFFFLGSGFPYRNNPPLHSGDFHINEDCIKTGITVICALCLSKN